MTTFHREWANRHDGECEKRKVAQLNSDLTRSLLVKHDLVACHCYRRWLEARLGEIHKIIHPVLDTHDALRAVDRLRALLPPKGAGDEQP